MGGIQAGHGLVGRSPVALRIHNPNELGEVVAKRRAHVGLASADSVSPVFRLLGQVGVDLSRHYPRAQPLLPMFNLHRSPYEVVVVNALGNKAWRPVIDRGLDSRVGHSSRLLSA